MALTSRWGSVDLLGSPLVYAHDDLRGRDLPCHRVVNRADLLTGGWHFGHSDVMHRRLLGESVPFIDDYQVDLPRCLWEPWPEGEEEER